MRNFKEIGILAAGCILLAGPAQAISFYDVSPDGAKYTLSWVNTVGQTYEFTYTANFTGAAGSAALGDYVSGISVASQPGSVNWTSGGVTAAPTGSLIADWAVQQNVVTSSGGCPVGGVASKDVCIGLLPNALAGNQITTSSVLTWKWLMTWSGDAPDFDGSPAWSYKFVTTTGTWVPGKNGKPGDWEFGNYQISRTFGICTDAGECEPGDETVPEPGSLALLGFGLLGLGLSRRKVRA